MRHRNRWRFRHRLCGHAVLSDAGAKVALADEQCALPARPAPGRPGNGSSNSRSSVKNCRLESPGAGPGSVVTSGVDTLSLAWRPSVDDPFDALRAEGFTYGPAGSLIAAKRGPADERVLAWPSFGVLAIEGRAGAILSGEKSDHSLMAARLLPDVERTAGDVLERVVGWAPGARDVCEVRRYDLAYEQQFEDGREGLAFLAGLAKLCPPRMRCTHEIGGDGKLQTAYVRTAKRGEVRQRFYDKGVESGSHAPGERIRLESQLRPAKRERKTPHVLAAEDLTTHFARGMVSYMRSGEGLVVAGSSATVQQLAGQVARGDLSAVKAERLIGSMTLLREYGRSIYGERQGQRRVADLRGAGVILDAELPPQATVPLGQLLREAVETFAA